MILGLTVAPRITAACGRADPAAWRSAIQPDLRPLGGRAHRPILKPYALTALPTHVGEARSRTATAPARTGPPVRNDNRGAIRPIQPDGTRLGADDLGLAGHGCRRFKIITACWNKSGYTGCSVERSAFSRTAMQGSPG